MAQAVKAGAYLYRINPSNDRELHRASMGSSSFSHIWSAPNGERILDIIAKGDEVFISTTRHTYVRSKSGGINLK